MRAWRRTLGCLSVAALSLTSMLPATSKVDFGPVYINMRVLEDGRTKDHLDLGGARVDATIQPLPGHPYLKGVAVKPTFTYAVGGRGHYTTGGLGLGHFIPVGKCVLITPLVGVTWSRLTTRTDFPMFGLFRVREKFTSWTPYAGGEISWFPNDTWMFSASMNWGWAKTRTHLDGLGLSKGESQGPVYSAMVDYYLNKCWSINVAVGYNHSKTQEKHGIRGLGTRVGTGYTW